MRVFKFGGASIKNAAGIRNVAEIVKSYKESKLILVVSALGKTTNALEEIAEAVYNKEAELSAERIQELKDDHFRILDELFEDKSHIAFRDLDQFFERLFDIQRFYTLKNITIDAGYDYLYDQIVSFGELMSTNMVSHYLRFQSLPVYSLDVRTVLKTDSRYREGGVNWEVTEQLIRAKLQPLISSQLVVTQGFLGSTVENHTTTLGREGSDYTAAIMAYCLDAEELVIWKDVPGVLNADPRLFPNARLLQKISYNEAVELAYYGATVIHPKTIKPLQNKNITLRVRSFIHPTDEGTIVNTDTTHDSEVPSIIYKQDQTLLTLGTKDFSFIIEENLSHIFRLFADFGVKVGMMQATAICFSVCINHERNKLPALIKTLEQDYRVDSQHNLELVTIRHYDTDTVTKALRGKEPILTQEGKVMSRYVVTS
ncbi:aspartate kinase [soil metagenome]